MDRESYLEAVGGLAGLATDYILALEDALENFRLRELDRYQKAIGEKYRQRLTEGKERLARLEPPAELESRHRDFSQAFTHLEKSCQIFTHPFRPEEWILCIRGSHHEICEARRLLYQLRRQIPGLASYWVTADATLSLDEIEAEPNPSPGVPVGLLYRDWDPEPPRYTLYVPEGYRPQRSYPLAVALHGGGGNDHDFIWLWLRYARSRGFILVAPKSLDMTWTFSDAKSIGATVRELESSYNINPKGIFLTGLSDGGTFAYEFGIGNHELFAAIAPISGALVPWPWHDFARASHLPVYIQHGARDRIIPVELARSARDFLEQFGFKVIYKEFPDWGHALPFSKIASVFDFFQQVLEGKAQGLSSA